MKLRVLLFAVLVLSSGCLGKKSFNWSNDIVGGTDENFTNQVRLQHNSKVVDTPESIIKAYEFIPAFDYGDSDPKSMTRVVQTLENNMYTPNDLRSKEVVKDDVPYSGITEVRFKRFNEAETKRISTELSLGVTGQASGTEQLQKFVHVNLDMGTDPQGWGHQMATEPTVNLQHKREWEIQRIKIAGLDFVSMDTTCYRVGTVHTDVEISHGWKYGYSIDDLSGEINNFSAFFSVFGAVRGVARNLHYDGTVFRESEHTVNSMPFVASINFAPTVNWKNYVVQFDYNIRSRDYEEQKSSTQSYGILSLGTIW